MSGIDFELFNANKEKYPEVYNEVYEKTIDDRIRKTGISLSEELAVLRKTVKYILEIIGQLHEGELDIERFTKHSDAIERIIKEVDEIFEEGTK